MSEIDAIVGDDFIRHLEAGDHSSLPKSYATFSTRVINFIHKPIAWVEKHHVLVRLKAAIMVHHNTGTECPVKSAFLTCSMSLIDTMRKLLVKAQHKHTESLQSHRSGFLCANGQPLEWTDSNTAFHELIQGIHAKGSFNNDEAEISDIHNLFANTLGIDSKTEDCYESGRQMKRRKGRPGAEKYDRRKAIASRTYYLDDVRAALNDRWIQQDAAGNGRTSCKNTK